MSALANHSRGLAQRAVNTAQLQRIHLQLGILAQGDLCHRVDRADAGTITFSHMFFFI